MYQLPPTTTAGGGRTGWQRSGTAQRGASRALRAVLTCVSVHSQQKFRLAQNFLDQVDGVFLLDQRHALVVELWATRGQQLGHEVRQRLRGIPFDIHESSVARHVSGGEGRGRGERLNEAHCTRTWL